jgi:hypothetical protein
MFAVFRLQLFCDFSGWRRGSKILAALFLYIIYVMYGCSLMPYIRYVINNSVGIDQSTQSHPCFWIAWTTRSFLQNDTSAMVMYKCANFDPNTARKHGRATPRLEGVARIFLDFGNFDTSQ